MLDLWLKLFQIALKSMLYTLLTLVALAKRRDNQTGTGGGAGQTLTDAESQALNAMITRDSDLVDGIPGGQEVGLPNSKQNAEAVASASSAEVYINSSCYVVF